MEEKKPNYIQKNWLWIITGLLILSSIAVIYFCKLQNASQVGDWLSGFSSTLAFLWIIAGFYQQSKELSLQRKELSLQRESLDLQAGELKGLNQFQSLEHIKNILYEALKKINNTNTLFNPLLNQMENISIITKTHDLEECWAAAEKVLNEYTPILSFLQSFSAALMLYMDSKNIDYSINDEAPIYWFLLVNIDHGKRAPYLGEHYIQVKKACQSLATLDKIYKIVMLVFMIKSQTLFSSDILEDGALEDLYSKLLKDMKGDKNSLPPVIRDYFKNSKLS